MALALTKRKRAKSKRTKSKQNKSKRIKSKKTNKIKNGGAKTTCCMCDKKKNFKNTMAPSACYIAHGQRAHRICQECWWNPETGFARENADHTCPGCKESKPLNIVKKESTPVIIDLTLE
jgi:hypothetical protein